MKKEMMKKKVADARTAKPARVVACDLPRAHNCRTAGATIAVDGLPGGWVSVRLGDLFEFCYGKALSAGERNASGRVPVYGSSGITGYHDIAWVNRPCIIVGRKGAAGKVILTTEPCWPIDTTYFVTPQEGLDLKFFFHLFTNLRFEKLEKSTAIPSLSRDDAYDQTIPLPPLNEQKRIVAKIEELFSELDAGEENLRLARKQLGVYRQSLLKQAFEGRLTVGWRKLNAGKVETGEKLLGRIQKEREVKWNGKGKFKGSAVPEIKNLGELPAGWALTCLAQLKVMAMYGPRFSSDEYSAEGIRVLRTTDFSEHGSINFDTPPRLPLSPEVFEPYKLQKDDLLITRTGSLGTLAIFPGGVDAIAAAFLIYYRLPLACVSAEYIYFVLKSPLGQSRLIGGGAGVGRPNLNMPLIDGIPIPICSLPEQQEIVRLLAEQFEAIEQNEREIDAALVRSSALRQSILKQAFAGKLALQNAKNRVHGVSAPSPKGLHR